MTTISALPQNFAIVAGGGAFPDLLAKAVSDKGCRVFAVRLTGHAEPHTLHAYEGMNSRPEQMGLVFGALRARGIKDIVLIGKMRRPDIFALRPDWTTLRLLPKILPTLLFKGDDALLRSVRAVLEQEGFALRGAFEFMGDMLARSGPMGRHVPNESHIGDIALGVAAARALGRRDAGQAVIIKNAEIVGEEDREGTDALIRKYGCVGAVLVKMAKPQQDRFLDLPAIGPDTVKNCAEKGMAGIAVESGNALVANFEETVALADAHGLFVTGIP